MFWVHDLLCLLLSILIMVTVPRVVSGLPPLHLSGLATETVLPLLALGATALGGHALLSVRSEHPMIPLRLLTEPRFLRVTFGAAAVLGTLGVVIVAIPLPPGKEYDASPAVVGFAVLGLAGAMTFFIPIASRSGEWTTL